MYLLNYIIIILIKIVHNDALLNNTTLPFKSLLINDEKCTVNDEDDDDSNNNINCVRKCCPFGMDFVINNTCMNGDEDHLRFLRTFRNYTDDFIGNNYVFSIGYKCNFEKVLFVLEDFDDYIISKSNLIWRTITFTKIFPSMEYCVDFLDGEFHALFCSTVHNKKYYYGKLN